MKHTLSYIAFVVVVLGLLWAISGTRSPRIPEDEAHRVYTTDVHCLDCHGPDGVAPRKPDHPPKDACLKCHKVKRNRKPAAD